MMKKVASPQDVQGSPTVSNGSRRPDRLCEFEDQIKECRSQIRALEMTLLSRYGSRRRSGFATSVPLAVEWLAKSKLLRPRKEHRKMNEIFHAVEGAVSFSRLS